MKAAINLVAFSSFAVVKVCVSCRVEEPLLARYFEALVSAISREAPSPTRCHRITVSLLKPFLVWQKNLCNYHECSHGALRYRVRFIP
ncbi:hypothetical protein CONLIGDRAFT_626969 [Coniochaeta ligniaria NRRL 30616]|uniref:Secreted protein n=1 Tax=Coniochaeta ligniaria NRRL 30616 TaxID=1408157 RepID=A0A1J7J617_9PEZI|nr:hypothetical protein CONLIGDRAFT_626969 [Coniochaeta ligniaria NRRL 30616]